MLLTLPEKILRELNLPQVQYIHDSLPKSTTAKPWSIRPVSAITEIVVHHAGDTGTVINEAKYHINNRGWYTISYHVSIDRGNILQLNDLLSNTSHAKGANGNSIGVCVNWNLALRPPTDFEYKALLGVIIALKEMFPNAKVSGHNEVGKRYGYGTACPVISMDKLRSDILTEELRQSVTETPNDMLARSVKVYARVSDLYKTASAAGKYQAEAQRKLTRIEAMMKAEGIL